MPRRVNDFRGLAEVSRVKLLGAVQKRPGSRLKELADEVGLHVNTARDHLRILIEEGFVCLEPAATGTRGRPPMVYRPVDDPESNGAARDRIDRAREHRRLLGRLANVDAGQPAALEELGEDAGAQFDVLYEHLDDSGMEPVADEEEMRISLAPCPHYRMVGDEREIACAIHANLVRSLLGQVPGPLELDRLLPFTSADTCQIMLRGADCPGTSAGVEPETGAGRALDRDPDLGHGPDGEPGPDPDGDSQ